MDAALPDGAPGVDGRSESQVSCHRGHYSSLSAVIHLLPGGYTPLGVITDIFSTEVPYKARERLCCVPMCVCTSR